MNHHSGHNDRTLYLPAVEKVIRPDMEAYAKKLKIYSVVSYVGVATCFVGFALGGISMTNSYYGGFPIRILIPFFGFGGFGILAALLSIRSKMAEALVSVMKQVKSTDKMEISDISYTFKNFKGDVLHSLRLLISTGNLPGYQIIDNRFVAKDGESIAPEERNAAQLLTCDLCGAELREGDAFCPKCGRRR